MPRPARENRTSNSSNEGLDKAVRSQRRNIVNRIALDLHANKSTGARSGHGVIEKCYLDNVGMHPWLKYESIRNAIRRVSNNYKNNLEQDNMSPTPTDNQNTNIPNSMLTREDSCSALSEVANALSSSSNSTVVKKIGRPQGSTSVSLQELETKKKTLCVKLL